MSAIHQRIISLTIKTVNYVIATVKLAMDQTKTNANNVFMKSIILMLIMFVSSATQTVIHVQESNKTNALSVSNLAISFL